MASVLHQLRGDPAVRGDDAETLAAIRAPTVALALWTRALPHRLAEAVAGIDLDTVDDLQLVLDLALSEAALAERLAASGYGEEAARLLAADMLMLASLHAGISGTPRAAARLEVIETDGCWKFHADYMRYRLLVTYRGDATQWMRADAPERIEQMRAGEVAVLKGRTLLDPPTVLHRSPPVETNGGGQRLLLVINPVDSD